MASETMEKRDARRQQMTGQTPLHLLHSSLNDLPPCHSPSCTFSVRQLLDVGQATQHTVESQTLARHLDAVEWYVCTCACVCDTYNYVCV